MEPEIQQIHQRGIDLRKGQREDRSKDEIKKLANIVTGYADPIQYILDLNHGSIHSTIIDDVSDFQSRGYCKRKSVRMALNKNRYLLDEMWDDEVEFDERDSEKDEENSYTF